MKFFSKTITRKPLTSLVFCFAKCVQLKNITCEFTMFLCFFLLLLVVALYSVFCLGDYDSKKEQKNTKKQEKEGDFPLNEIHFLATFHKYLFFST